MSTDPDYGHGTVEVLLVKTPPQDILKVDTEVTKRIQKELKQKPLSKDPCGRGGLGLLLPQPS